jgi:hypothetical protein
MSELIVMLTHNDVTVENARQIFAECKDLPVTFWGFKNIGLPLDQMKELVADMKAAGKTTFLEVVTLQEPDCMEGAKMAKSCGFDYLLGTVYFDSVAQYVTEHNIAYLPFCGTVTGHPSILSGSIEQIVADGLRLQDLGVQGTDLLAYRHKEDPENLIREVCARLTMPVIVAGSISTFERIDLVEEINPWAYTIGSALFEHKFSEATTFRGQLEAVLNHVAGRDV